MWRTLEASTAPAILALLASTNCAQTTSVAPEGRGSEQVGVMSGEIERPLTVTRDAPIVRQMTDHTKTPEVDFARITIVENTNPDNVAVEFRLVLVSDDEEENEIGTFGPFPPDREQTYLLPFQPKLKSGDVLELRMSPLRPSEEGEIVISLSAIELKSRDDLSKEREQ